MTLAYLLSSYPMTSTTFIRREIAAHEDDGVPVIRYAVRPWDVPLVDTADIEEARRTTYILSGNLPGLAMALVAMLATRPGRALAGMAGAWRLWRGARDGLVRHAAYFLQAAYLTSRMRRDGVTHLHTHFAANATAVAMLARLMGGPAYSFTVHGPHDLFDAPLLSVREKATRAKAVVAITSYCRSQLRMHVAPADWGRIHVVGCGVFTEEFPLTPPAPNQTLLCVGRLCPEKGQAALPGVVARLVCDFPDIEVQLVGDGPDRSVIEAGIRAHGVEKHLRVLGWKDTREIVALLGRARALLLPSYAEGLPVVIMEALASGRPVISTYIAGIPELVDAGCGWLAPASDDIALGAAIAAALSADPGTLRALGEEGRARVEARHDQRANARILRELIMSAP